MEIDKFSDVKQSLTKNGKQVNWKIPTEFVCCPQEISENPIMSYFENLQIGKLFCKNEVYSNTVFDFNLSDDKKILFVATQSTDTEAIKPWAIVKIVYIDSFFVHYSLGSFFEEIGVRKYFCLEQGKEWDGEEDCFDDNS